jgi:thioredoxin reductase (NADPH)
VVEAHGDEHLEALTLLHSDTGTRETVPATALFIFIGAAPRTEWLEGTVQRDRYGFIPTGSELLREGRRPRGWDADREPFLLEASVPGVFAAGDVTPGLQLVQVAAGSGAVAGIGCAMSLENDPRTPPPLPPNVEDQVQVRGTSTRG